MKLEFSIPQKNKYHTLKVVIERLSAQWSIETTAIIREGGGATTTCGATYTVSTNSDSGIQMTITHIAVELIRGDVETAARKFAELVRGLSNRTPSKLIEVNSTGSFMTMTIRPSSQRLYICSLVDDIEVY